MNVDINTENYIEKGYIDVNDDVAFKRIYEVCNIFGHSYKGYQRAGAKHPYREDVTIWFPKLYPNNAWVNTISTDETIIYERPSDSTKIQEHMNEHIEKGLKRIVFAHEIDNSGLKLYRFKGEFKINIESSYEKGCLVWNRIAERVDTYPPKE